MGAALFGGVQSVWTVAATLTLGRPPFETSISDSKKEQMREVHCAEFLAEGVPASDHLAASVAYKRWEKAQRNNVEDSFCRENFLSRSTLHHIREARDDIVERILKTEGYIEKFSPQEVSSEDLLSPQLATALIFAGLYPNVARVDAPNTPLRKTPVYSAGSAQNAENLKIHKISLCYGNDDNLWRTNNRWLCYQSKVKTTEIFIRDCSFVLSNAMLLFGGADPSWITMHPMEHVVSLGLAQGGERLWQTLHVPPRTAALIRQLRYTFDRLMHRKMSEPQRPLASEDRAVIAAYVSVLTHSKANWKFDWTKLNKPGQEQNESASALIEMPRLRKKVFPIPAKGMISIAAAAVIGFVVGITVAFAVFYSRHSASTTGEWSGR